MNLRAHESEFGPDPLDANAIVSSMQADLEGFNHYVEREIFATQLFGNIVSKLLGERPDETRTETDVAGGKVGLEIARITGELPARFTDPNARILQDVHYPPVRLPDDNYAQLSEVVHRRSGLDSTVVARIPWLYIVSGEALTDFQRGKVDYLADVALEGYCRYDLDPTGETEGEPPFSIAHRLFFLHPIGQKTLSEMEEEKQELIEQQATYISRLQAISTVVHDTSQN